MPGRVMRNGVDCLLYVMRNARITDDAIVPQRAISITSRGFGLKDVFG